MSVLETFKVASACEGLIDLILGNELVFLGLMLAYLCYGIAELVLFVIDGCAGFAFRMSVLVCRVVVIASIFSIAALYGIEHLGEVRAHAALHHQIAAIAP